MFTFWCMNPVEKRVFPLLVAVVGLLLAGWAAPVRAAETVYIGLVKAVSISTSTTAKAIERGVRAAMEEINARGGVLGGRPLRLITTDNQGVSARGRDNFVELAGKPGIVAVLGGKFSPITVETVPEANRLRVPLVSVWGSADPITEGTGGQVPPYAFRVSLKDSWGVEAMMKRARTHHRATRLCALLPNTSWGRSSDRVMNSRAQPLGVQMVSIRWYNWGDQNFTDHLQSCNKAGGQVLLMVANEREASSVLTQLAQQPAAQRLPVIAHWGITGGVLHELAPDALDKVDMQVIQTFTFIGNTRPAARRLATWLMRDGDFAAPKDIPSPVGSAHAYDATHLLAMAVDKAGSTLGPKVRAALESLPAFEGAVRRYAPAFTPQRHDALGEREVLFVRMERSGALVPVK